MSLAKRAGVFLAISSAVMVTGCTQSNAKLVNGESQVYVGGLVSQRVNGDANMVSVWNVWTAKDGLPLANQHCQKYGKPGAEIVSKTGITAYYKCQQMTAASKEKIFDSDVVKSAVSNITSCIRTNVVVLDDFVSDANTIAQAVAQQCRAKMDRFVDAYISQIPNSGSLSTAYADNLKTQFAENEKNRVLPFVLGWRSLVKNGWDRRTPPTEKEAPDQLFSQTI